MDERNSSLIPTLSRRRSADIMVETRKAEELNGLVCSGHQARQDVDAAVTVKELHSVIVNEEYYDDITALCETTTDRLFFLQELTGGSGPLLLKRRWFGEVVLRSAEGFWGVCGD